MREILAIYFTGYLYTMMFLTPLILLLIVGLKKKSALSLLLKVQKTILCLSLLAPALMTFHAMDLGIGAEKPKIPVTQTSDLEEAINRYFPERILVKPSSVQDLAAFDIIDLIFYLSHLIALGSMLGLGVFAWRVISQHIKMIRLTRSASKIIRVEGIKVCQSKLVTSPFAAAMWTRQIFLPPGLKAKEQEIILKHEINHFKCNHHLWSIFESFQNHFFWYNPLMLLLRKSGYFLREVECDVATIKDINPFDYSHVLLSTAESLIIPRHNPMLALSWIDKDVLKHRIEYILGEEKSRRRLWLQRSFVACLAFIATGYIYVGKINDEFLEKELHAKITREYSESLENRSRVQFDQLPEHFVTALLIHEDGEFFDHQGVSWFHVARASLTTANNFLSGSPAVSGGSTITQQLAKSFISREKTLSRKLRELKVARVLEKNFSKSEIIEMYLNRAYFGNNAWGLANATKTYFNRSYDEISLEEATMIVPFLDAPTAYNLLDNPKVAKQRQEKLLNRLLATQP